MPISLCYLRQTKNQSKLFRNFLNILPFNVIIECDESKFSKFRICFLFVCLVDVCNINSMRHIVQSSWVFFFSLSFNFLHFCLSAKHQFHRCRQRWHAHTCVRIFERRERKKKNSFNPNIHLEFITFFLPSIFPSLIFIILFPIRQNRMTEREREKILNKPPHVLCPTISFCSFLYLFVIYWCLFTLHTLAFMPIK